MSLDEVRQEVPLDVVVGVEEAALPQAGELLRLLLSGLPRHRGKHHQSLPLLGHLQQLLRLGGVHLGEVDGRRRPLVLGEVPFLNVIVLLRNMRRRGSAVR